MKVGPLIYVVASALGTGIFRQDNACTCRHTPLALSPHNRNEALPGSLRTAGTRLPPRSRDGGHGAQAAAAAARGDGAQLAPGPGGVWRVMSQGGRLVGQRTHQGGLTSEHQRQGVPSPFPFPTCGGQSGVRPREGGWLCGTRRDPGRPRLPWFWKPLPQNSVNEAKKVSVHWLKRKKPALKR